MTERLQRFDFESSPYERPSDTWVCGRAADGRACRLGPTRLGRCRTTHACDPDWTGDGWTCTRPACAGGPCEDGPGEDGTCCQKAARCSPQRTMRSHRGRITRWVAVATLGILAVIFGYKEGLDIVEPGAVIQGHAEVGECAACHSAFDVPGRSWIFAAFSPADPVADSQKCLTCHARGQDALNPHNLPTATLSDYTKRAEHQLQTVEPPLLMTVSERLFERHDETTEALACGTCHKDHKGETFDPSLVSNERCQSCHQTKFASLADGHPAFDAYPYMRRTRLAFDHHKHFRKNFADAKTDRAPKSCAVCHTPDSSGRSMVVRAFEQTCEACHAKDIEGKSVAGPKGIPVFSVPGLDTETLAERGREIGDWPDLALAEDITPFMKLLLAADVKLSTDLDRLATLDLQDLEKANADDLASVERVAWAIKELLYDFTISGADTIEARLEGRLAVKMDRVSLGRLLGHIPLDVVRAARRAWFPGLKREMEGRRDRKAELGAPGTRHAASDAYEGAVRIALAPAVNGIATDAFDPGLFGYLRQIADARGSAHTQDRAPVQLAQAGDLLTGSDDLLDKDSLRLDDLKRLLKEDGGGDKSLFKAAPPTAKKKSKPANKTASGEKQDEPAKDKKPPAATAETAAGEKKPAPKSAEGPKITPAPRVAVEETEATTAARPERGKTAKSEQSAPDEADRDESLDPDLDPEAWARLGGWYRQDDTLFYRPVAHRDPFMQAWLDISAAAHGTKSERYGAPIMALLRAKDTPGKCTKCHSIDKVENDRLLVNWQPFTPNPEARHFTVFDHTAHFSLVEDKGCGTCHALDTAAKFADGFADSDPRSFASNFAPMDREVCATCHVAESAGEACVSCHKYHIGEFPNTPVRTLVARLPTAGGGSPSATAPRVPVGARPDDGSGDAVVSRGDTPAPERSGATTAAQSGSPAQTDGRVAVAEIPPPPAEDPAPDPGAENGTAPLADQPDGSGIAVLRLSTARSLEGAIEEQVRLERRYPALLRGKTLRVERVDRGRQVLFYRVTAGPYANRRGARVTCDRFKALGQHCEAAVAAPAASESSTVLGELGAAPRDEAALALSSVGQAAGTVEPNEILERARAVVEESESRAFLRPKLKPTPPPKVSGSTRVVLRLAEFESAEKAADQRDRLRSTFPELLGGHDVQVQTIALDSDRKRYLMIVASVSDPVEAEDVCEGLRSHGQVCEVTRQGDLSTVRGRDVSYGPNLEGGREFPSHK